MQILRDLTFSVAPGQSVAIVGPSGSGKSTVLKLLARLYPAGGGSIHVAGQEVNTLQQGSLRRHLAVVPQDTVLFNDTIMENIRYGRLDASDAEVRAHELRTRARLRCSRGCRTCTLLVTSGTRSCGPTAGE